MGGHGDPLLQEAFLWVLELQRGMLGHCLLPIGEKTRQVWEHWAGPAPPGWAENSGMSRTQSQPQRESTADPDPRSSIPLFLPHPLRSKQLLQHRAKHRAKASTPSAASRVGIPKPHCDPSSIHWFRITKGHRDEITGEQGSTHSTAQSCQGHHPAPLAGRTWVIPRRTWVIPERTNFALRWLWLRSPKDSPLSSSSAGPTVPHQPCPPHPGHQGLQFPSQTGPSARPAGSSREFPRGVKSLVTPGVQGCTREGGTAGAFPEHFHFSCFPKASQKH